MNQKGLAPIYFLIGLVFLLFIPFVPIPRQTSLYNGNTLIKKWYVYEPLWKKVSDYYSRVTQPDETPPVILPSEKPLLVFTSSPNPSPTESTFSSDTNYVESTQSANWKTYTNIKYKYKFKYPPDWKLIEENPSDPKKRDSFFRSFYIELQSSDYKSTIASEIEPYLVILDGSKVSISNPVTLPKNKSLTEFVKETYGVINEYSIKSIKIGEQEAVEAESSMQFGTQYQISKHIYVLYNGEVYQLRRTFREEQEADYRETFIQIVSTFKFLP